MRTFLFSVSLLCASSLAFAQSNMVNFFDRLPTEAKHGYSIDTQRGRYIASTDNGEIEVLVDDNNGYLEIRDTGTGGGESFLQVAQFKTAEGESIIACSYHNNDGSINGAIVDFYDPSNGMESVSISVFPMDLSDEMFLKEGESVTDEAYAQYHESIFYWFELPREGTTMQVHMGFNSAEADCMSGTRAACRFTEAYNSTRAAKFNKQTGSFRFVN